MANFSTTPLAIDEYARFMTDVFDERQVIAVSTVFQAFFGRPETGGRTLFSPDSAVVDIDIVRGNERLAALIHRGSNGRDLGTGQANTIQQQFSHISRVYPLIEEMGDIDSNQLLFRLPGENPFSQRSRIDRMRAHASEHHQEHVRRIVRLFEYLAAQSILTGKMPAIFGTTDANLQYDFLRNPAHTFTPITTWDNAGADPIGNVETACQLIRENGHARADIALMGSEAMAAFIAHGTVQTLADNRRFELVQVNSNPVPPNLQRFIDAGAVPRGHLRTPNGYDLWLFSYIDVYTNSAGSPTKYMPEKDVVIGASTARCDRYFGPPERLPDIPARDQLYQQLFGFAPGMAPMPPRIMDVARAISPAMFYFDAYVSDNWKRVSVRSQAAPIFATTQTDAFATLEDVVP
jgi:hypothetical protein